MLPYRPNLVAVLAVVLIAGCSLSTSEVVPVQPGLNQFHSPHEPLPRRVLMLPLGNETQHYDISRDLHLALGTEFRNAGVFETVPAPPELTASLSDEARIQGQYNERDLITLSQTYHVDAILIGSVTDYHAYWPPRIGIVLNLVSCETGSVVMSLDQSWDAREAATAHRADQFFETHVEPGWRPNGGLGSHSPSYFRKFVSHEVAQSMVLNPIVWNTPAQHHGARLPNPLGLLGNRPMKNKCELVW